MKSLIEKAVFLFDCQVFHIKLVSLKKGAGFTNTFFTRNASEISKRIEYFESELSDLLKEVCWTEENSRRKAIEELTTILKSIKE